MLLLPLSVCVRVFACVREQQQRLVQASNGVDNETMVITDGKPETLENGTVPEDKTAEEEEGEALNSPFTIPGGCMRACMHVWV